MVDILIEAPPDIVDKAWDVYESGNDKDLPYEKRISHYHEAFSLAFAAEDLYLQALVLNKLAQNAYFLAQRLNRYERALKIAHQIAHMDLIVHIIHTVCKDRYLSTKQQKHYCKKTISWATDTNNPSLQALTYYEMTQIEPSFTQRLQYYFYAFAVIFNRNNTSLESTISWIYQNLRNRFHITWHR